MKQRHHSRVRTKIAACLVVLAAAVWWWWPQGPREEPSADRQEPRRPPVMSDPREAETPRVSSEQEVAEPKRATPSPKAIYLHKYLDWFESICPSLTTEEEDRLLEKVGRSPEMLTVLALMRSSRREAFLEEALQADPPPRIALHMAILQYRFTGNKIELAEKLGGVYGNMYRAFELSKAGGAPEDIINALKTAAHAPEGITPWMEQVLPLQEQAFIDSGRDPFAAKTRTLLDYKRGGEGYLISKLADLVTSGSLASAGENNHYATALVLDLTQKIIQSPGFELDTVSSARYAERRIYEHLQSQGVTEFPYSSVSISEALAEVEADAVANYRIRLFSLDKGGIFQRLPLEAQQTLLQDITEQGEVPAFQAIVQQFPDIFLDPDFPPQGTDPAKWNPRVVVNRDGTVVKER